ncbi:DUF1054 domain-containing protein [Paenibacillus sp. JX-17]|uniref:UPF0637 protein Q5741_02555 n=1 Tax=Paenibacillus lacisoli TaxID=3064525 RepID=A0ABT9C7R6_9BACL|nr:DUF1054 domain-containing protein [Paenibacillus sp. JX-17]MDO7905294.1 DUF1054 domain-containing protein [Paenibacillus sp. JX-17]
MTAFTGFDQKDFDVFEIPGLEPRMEVLIERVRPKLEQLGAELAPFLSELSGEPMYVHVAKHARRTVNPPKDTWVAWASAKRGYKALPHFEVGMFATHVFVIFAIIYESPNKTTFAEGLDKKLQTIRKELPSNFYWSMDHMSPEGLIHGKMEDQDFQKMIDKLRSVKKAEVMCGLRINAGEDVLKDGEQLLETIRNTFKKLTPLYQIAF